MEIIDFDKTKSDSDKLDAMMRMTENILEEVVQSKLLFRHDQRDNIAESWEEIKPKLQKMRRLLRKDPAGLAKAGLKGPNLSFKAQGLFHSYWYLNREGGVWRILKSLGWAKIGIGSLATCVPVVREFAEILNEFIEGIQIALEDSERA